MKKIKCPYCYGIHDLNSIMMKCSYNIPGQAKQCVGNVQKDNYGFIAPKDKPRCLKCNVARKSIYCSVGRQKREIPNDFLLGENFSVALIGAKASGKSNYIAVLINEIRKKMAASFNCSLNICASEESKSLYDSFYYKPLFVDGHIIDANAKDEMPPLICPLRFMNNRNEIVNIATLTFYDTAGENLNSTGDILINNRYIPNADGIIILLDPLQMPTIRAKLQGKMDLPAQNTDPVEILSRVSKIIRDVKNIKGKIKIPIALAFTKIDVLDEYGILREDSVLKTESEHLQRGVFVQSDFEAVNIEIRDLLDNFVDQEIIQQLKNFETYSLFGLSALGSSPKGRNIVNPIKPRRVLDPLLWIFSQKKYIKKVKK